MYKEMKKIIVLSALALFMIACDNRASYEEWKGEYRLQVTTETRYSDGSAETYSEFVDEKPMRIYEKDGHLYVQSCFGQPYLGIGDAPDPISAPQRAPQAVDSVVPVPPSTTPIVVIQNGFIMSLYNGVRYYPLPVKVVSVRESILKLEKGKTFEVPIADLEGVLSTVECYNHYEPICREGDYLSWEVELRFKDPLLSAGAPPISAFHYHCTSIMK